MATASLAALGIAACGGSSNTYWYCWDTGDPSPHHLGHPTSGDHLCSNSELDKHPPPGSEMDGLDHSAP